MKKLCLATLFFALLSPSAFGQQLTQTVRGVVLDLDSKLPLAGATVTIPGTEPVIGTITNASGNFRLENVPVGRITLQLSYLGYENQIVPNIVVNSGKEVLLELHL